MAEVLIVARPLAIPEAPPGAGQPNEPAGGSGVERQAPLQAHLKQSLTEMQAGISLAIHPTAPFSPRAPSGSVVLGVLERVGMEQAAEALQPPGGQCQNRSR